MPADKDKAPGLSPEISRLSAQLAKDPKSKLFMPLAEEYMKSGMVEEAIQALDAGLKANPSYMSARVLLGKAHLEKGDTDGAREQFEAVVKAIPDNLFALRKLGEIYKAQGRYEDAKKSLKVVAILSPKDEEVGRMLKELEQGVAPLTAAKPSDKDMTLESHRPKEEAEKGRMFTPPAPQEESPAGEGPKVFDLTEVEEALEEGGTEVAVEAVVEEGPDQRPAVVEMPVPEMETLAQVQKVQGEADEAVEAAEEPYAAPFEEEMPFAVEPDESVEETGGFVEEAGTLDEAAGPLDFGEVLSASDGPPEVKKPPERPRGSYAVDLGSKDALKDIFSSFKGGPEEETYSLLGQPVYEITEDIASLDTPGPGVEVPAHEPEQAASREAIAGKAAAKEPIETETLAELYISQGFYDRAINIYKNLLVEKPGDGELKKKLDGLYLLTGKGPSTASATAKEDRQEVYRSYEPVDLDIPPDDAEVFETLPFEESKPPSAAKGNAGADDAATYKDAISRLEQFLSNIRGKGKR